MLDFLSEPQRWAVPAVLLLALVGTPAVLWWERRHPSSYTRLTAMPTELASGWESMSTDAQRAHDDAVLAAQEAAEAAAGRAALLKAVKTNSLFRP
ncbi:hypothetical protein ACFV0T_26600 [Streptomyces sp. NPDC059582]|uniref:hypothetical protein n=1 Tax=Streptomyces sp. NPDC059582 TaxID=3346875 RepID=UPI0036B0A272